MGFQRKRKAFLIGDGTGKPTGIFPNRKAVEKLAFTAASDKAVTADEADRPLSIRFVHRTGKMPSFIMNDATVKLIRKA